MRGIHQVVQRVVDRPQIGIDLLAQIARQEAEPFAGLDRGPRQDDAIDFLAFEQLRSVCHRQPGLAGAGRADAEYQLVAFQRANIGVLGGGARPHRPLAQIDGLERRLAVLVSNSNSEPCAITARIAPSTSPWSRSWPWAACAYSVSSTRRAASQPSRDPAMVM